MMMMMMMKNESETLIFLIFRSADAICQNFQLEQDDIIILSTDGLFDNVPHRLIERILASVNSHES